MHTCFGLASPLRGTRFSPNLHVFCTTRKSEPQQVYPLKENIPVQLKNKKKRDNTSYCIRLIMPIHSQNPARSLSLFSLDHRSFRAFASLRRIIFFFGEKKLGNLKFLVLGPTLRKKTNALDPPFFIPSPSHAFFLLISLFYSFRATKNGAGTRLVTQ